MALVSNTYGKGRVRVMRVERSTDRHEVRELTVKAMVEGDFAQTYTDADNSKCLSTDTVKNVINIVARENLALDSEEFCTAVAQRLLDKYPQVWSAKVEGFETKWVRSAFGGKEHNHTFTLDSNGKPFATVSAPRGKPMTIVSGIDGFTFLKTTESGWDNYARDPYTTIMETRDRMCATAMLAHWSWVKKPADYKTANAKVLSTALEVFGTTYSASVQDSLYRMGMAVLTAVPEVHEISFACPNKHYLLMNLSAFNLDNNNVVFLPTDEPHGQIECTVGR